MVTTGTEEASTGAIRSIIDKLRALHHIERVEIMPDQYRLHAYATQRAYNDAVEQYVLSVRGSDSGIGSRWVNTSDSSEPHVRQYRVDERS